jgi:hypothetical protein
MPRVTAPAFTIPGHAFSVGAVLGTFLGFLPPTLAVVATALAILFYLVQIWESPTVQTWVKGREFVRLRQRQIAAAKRLAISQAAQAKALKVWQDAEAAALKVSEKTAIQDAAPVLPSSPLTPPLS